MRQKGKWARHFFNLNTDDPEEKQIHEYLEQLSESGKARQFIVDCLKGTVPTLTIHDSNGGVQVVRPSSNGKPMNVSIGPGWNHSETIPDDPSYTDAEEPA